jgi:hypothetical protein
MEKYFYMAKYLDYQDKDYHIKLPPPVTMNPKLAPNQKEFLSELNNCFHKNRIHHKEDPSLNTFMYKSNTDLPSSTNAL